MHRFSVSRPWIPSIALLASSWFLGCSAPPESNPLVTDDQEQQRPTPGLGSNSEQTPVSPGEPNPESTGGGPGSAGGPSGVGPDPDDPNPPTPNGGRPQGEGGSGAGPAGAGGQGNAGSGGTDPIPDPDEPLANCATPGPRMVRRLTANQYRNTLVDVFQDPNVPEADVLTDPAVLGFHVDADAAVIRDLGAEQLLNYAETVAAWAVDTRLGSITPCMNQDAQCRRQFIESFGQRIQREPLPEERIAPYEQLMAEQESFEAGAEVVITAMLQSPYLLYRRELGQPDPSTPGEVVLSPWEIASELSYFLTDHPPDQQLMDAAANGELATEAGLERAVDRLLNQPEARETLTHFVEGWLEIDELPKKAKDQNVFPITDPLRQAMLGETRELFLDLFFQGGTVADVFDANHTFLNRELSQFYGFGNVGSDTFQRVELPTGSRPPGVLGHASFLTEHALSDDSSPVQRGVIVRERLLCQPLPPVPENLDTNLDTMTEFSSNRERYEEHSQNPVCFTCHQSIDPVGFAFEEYDGFGRVRDADATGELSGIADTVIPLDGIESLSEQLAGSEYTRACVIRYWSYFAHGRDGWDAYECNRDTIRRTASEDDYSLRGILEAIVHAPHFTRRVAD